MAERLSAWTGRAVIVGLAALLVIDVIIVACIFYWPSIATVGKWYSNNRADLTPIGAGIGGAILAWVALGQLRTATRQAEIAARRHEEQTNADRQRRISESYSKAVEQLASEKIEARLGGIYTLERISKESPDDYWTIIETLTAFVRERARWKEPDPAIMESMARFDEAAKESRDQQRKREPPTDIAAVLTVIKRRDEANRTREKQMGWELDLRSTDLRGANLWDAHLEGAALVDAHLEDAVLLEARLESACLWRAHLKGVYLGDAHLGGAELRWADLSGAKGLTDGIIAQTLGNAQTILPVGIARPPNWPAAAAEPIDRGQPSTNQGGPGQ